MALLTVLAVGLLWAAGAQAAPIISLDKSGGSVLAGEDGSVTLTASNAASNPAIASDWGYNASFRDVLPVGVSLASTSVPTTSVIPNAPNPGETTVIWENVGDVAPGSTTTLTYSLSYDLDTGSGGEYVVGDTFTNSAGVYVNSDPRVVPDFGPDGQPTGDFTQSATDTADTTINPFELRISEPNAEGEILRGLHDHQTAYTFTLENNPAVATNNTTIYGAFPAGLELLACGTDDNTTDAPTNPGNTEEYSGSGPINPGNAPALGNPCPTLDIVETISGTSWDPDGLGGVPALQLPEGGVWTVFSIDSGNLAVGETVDFDLVAAIPIFPNTLSWPGGEPAPASGDQASNLDNNSVGSSETLDETSLTVRAQGVGEYDGPIGPGTPTPQSDPAELTRTAEDLSVHKSVDDGGIDQGQLSTWSMLIEASEYRRAEDIRITDTLPDGLCPLGGINFANNFGAGTNPECDPSGDLPTVSVNGGAPSDITADDGYTSATENANGTWTLVWDEGTVAELDTIAPSDTVTITFPSRTREFYQENFADAGPVLSNDSWQNSVDIEGPVFRQGSRNPGLSPFPGTQPDASIDMDSSSAGQQATGPSIRKQIATRASIPNLGVPCTAATYVAGPEGYSPGDRVCWQIRVDYPSSLDTGQAPIRDFIPPGHSYIAGSASPTGNNTVTTTAGDPVDEGGSLVWTPDGVTDSGSQVFEWVFATEIVPDAATADADITSNLMKYASINTANGVFPLRTQADMLTEQPVISLTKTNDASGPVAPGQAITYSVEVANGGSRDAIQTEVWDLLPDGIATGDVSSISSGGATSANVGGRGPGIEWNGLTVPAGGSITLTYDVTFPAGLSAGDTLTNEAGVREFESETNQGVNETWIPSNNIDPSQEPNANTDPADDTSDVAVVGAEIDKNRTTSLDQPGNDPDGQATIGEQIDYTIGVTFSANTNYFQPTLTDDYRQNRVTVPTSGPGSPSISGTADDSGWTINHNTSNGTITASRTDGGVYDPGGSDATLTLTYTATVRNVAVNEAGDNVRNDVDFDWNTQDGSGPAPVESDLTRTEIVEPDIELAKSNDATGPVGVNDTVSFTVTVANAAGRSTANDAAVTDVVPAGLSIVVGSFNVAPTSIVGQTITWNFADIDPGQSIDLTYEATVDPGSGAAATLTNNANATTTSLPGGGGRTSTSPNNPDPDAYSEDASSGVQLTAAQIDKNRTTSVDQPGNDPNTDATIGEEITYTVDVTIPGGTTLFQPQIVDDYDQARISISGVGLSGTADDGNWDVLNSGNTITITRDPGSNFYANDVDPPVDQILTLTYTGTVLNVGGNTAGDTVGNTANLTWNAEDGANQQTAGPATTTTTIVEPNLGITKTNDTGGAPITPGSPVTYTVTLTNADLGSTSIANAVTVTDPIPAGLALTVGSVALGGPAAADFVITEGNTGGDSQVVVDGSLDPDETLTITYEATLDGAGAGATIQNTASEVTFSLADGVNDAGRRQYNDSANSDVTTPAAAIDKSRTTSVDQPGNNTPSQATIGEEIVYTVDVTIPAGTTLFQPTITDDFPQGDISVSGIALGGDAADGNWTASSDGSEMTVTRDPASSSYANSTAAAQTLTLTYTGTVLNVGGNAGGDTIDNSADLAWNAADGADPQTAGPATTSTLIVEPALQVAKSNNAGGGRFVGDTITFTVDLSNTGPSASRANNVVVTDPIPAGMQLVVGSVALGGSGAGDLSIISGNGTGDTEVRVEGFVDPNQTPVITYEATITGGLASTITNTATATSTSLSGADGRSYSVDSPSSVAVVELGFTKTKTTGVLEGGNDLENQATIGETVTYTITTDIPADTTVHPTASTSFVADTLSDRLTIRTAEATLPGGAVIDLTNPTSGVFTISQSGQEIDMSLSGPFTNPNDDPTTVTLVIVATVDNEATNVSGDMFDNSADLAFGSTASPPGDGGQSLTNSASVDPITIVEPDIAITKTNDATEEVSPDDIVEYTVRITNAAGQSTAHDLVIGDTLPTELGFVEFTSFSTPGDAPAPVHDGSGTGGDISWGGFVLGPGEEAVMTYTALVQPGVPAGGTLPNTANATIASLSPAQAAPHNDERTPATDPPEPDRYAASDGSELMVASVAIGKDVSSDIIGAADGNTASEATLGETVTYTLTTRILAGTSITPHSTIPQFIRDTIPSNLTFTSATAVFSDPTVGPIGPIGPGNTATDGNDWSLASSGPENRLIGLSLAPGQSYTAGAEDTVITITIQATLDDEAQNSAGTVVPNEARLAWQSSSGEDETGSSDVDFGVVEPDLSVTKSNDASGPRSQGQEVGYSVVLTNGSGEDVSMAHSVDLADVVPAGMALVEGTISGAAPGAAPAPTFDPASRTISWAGFDLRPGESATLSYRARVETTIPGPLDNVVVVGSTSLPDEQGRSYSTQASSRIDAVPPPNPVGPPPAPPVAVVAACGNGGTVRVSHKILRVGVQTRVVVALRGPDGAPVSGQLVQIFREGSTAAANGQRAKQTAPKRGGAVIRPRQRLTDANGRARFSIRAPSTRTRLRVASPDCVNNPRIVARRTATCRGIRATHRQIDVGTRTRVRFILRNGRQPIRNTRVIARGPGVRVAGRTNAKGVVALGMKPTKAGAITMRAPSALGCSWRIGAAQVRGRGAALTG